MSGQPLFVNAFQYHNDYSSGISVVKNLNTLLLPLPICNFHSPKTKISEILSRIVSIQTMPSKSGKIALYYAFY